MSDLTYVDSQGVVLENGGEAHVELEYDEAKDEFAVTADPESYIDRTEDFRKENYPDEDWSERYDETREICKKLRDIGLIQDTIGFLEAE